MKCSISGTPSCPGPLLLPWTTAFSSGNVNWTQPEWTLKRGCCLSEPPAGIPHSLSPQVLRLPRFPESHHHQEPGSFPHDRHGLLLSSFLLPQKEGSYLGRFHDQPVREKLYQTFFEGYTEKVWGKSPKNLSADWGSQRIKGISIGAVLKDFSSGLFICSLKKCRLPSLNAFPIPSTAPVNFMNASGMRCFVWAEKFV